MLKNSFWYLYDYFIHSGFLNIAAYNVSYLEQLGG